MPSAADLADPDFKAAFLAHERQERINTGKVACLLVIVLMPAGVLLDWFVYRAQAAHFMLLRLSCSVLATFVWLAHFTATGQRHYRVLGLPIVLLPTVFIAGAPFSNPGGFRALFALGERGRNDYTHGMNIDLGAAGGEALDCVNVEGQGAGHQLP